MAKPLSHSKVSAWVCSDPHYFWWSTVSWNCEQSKPFPPYAFIIAVVSLKTGSIRKLNLHACWLYPWVNSMGPGILHATGSRRSLPRKSEVSIFFNNFYQNDWKGISQENHVFLFFKKNIFDCMLCMCTLLTLWTSLLTFSRLLSVDLKLARMCGKIVVRKLIWLARDPWNNSWKFTYDVFFLNHTKNTWSQSFKYREKWTKMVF